MDIDNLRLRCQAFTSDHPLSIGFRDTPVASIEQMVVTSDAIDVTLRAENLWSGTRRVRVPSSIWDLSDEEDVPDPLNLVLFWLEETLDNGAWRRWTQGKDGAWEPPSIDTVVQELLTATLEPTQSVYLNQFQAIIDTVGDSIVLYLKPDQWHEASIEDTAFDPPKVLEHADLVRIAPFVIDHFRVDAEATHWTLEMHSVHFKEHTRRVHVSLSPQKVPGDINPPGFLWWNLRSACEAWFDLYYSSDVPESVKLEHYAYGGWHQNSDGSWNLDLLMDMG